MQYDSFDPCDRVNTNPPSLQIIEKLEERRFLLSLLVVFCFLFYLSQLYVDYHNALSIRFFHNMVLSFFQVWL